jgi:hypothetical protein
LLVCKRMNAELLIDPFAQDSPNIFRHFLASAVEAAHDIYIWERAVGSLIKILEGPNEELTDIDVFLALCEYC